MHGSSTHVYGSSTHKRSARGGRGERTGASAGAFVLKLLLFGGASEPLSPCTLERAVAAPLPGSDRDIAADAAPLAGDGVVGGDRGSMDGGTRLEPPVDGVRTSAPPPAAPPGAAPSLISAAKFRWSTVTCIM